MVDLIKRVETPNYVSGGEVASVVSHYCSRNIALFQSFKQVISKRFNCTKKQKKEFEELDAVGKERIFAEGNQVENYYTELLRQECGDKHRIINFNEEEKIFVCEDLQLIAVPDIFMEDCEEDKHKLIEVKSGGYSKEKADRYFYQLALQKYLVESYYGIKVSAELHFVSENTTVEILHETPYQARIAEIKFAMGCLIRDKQAENLDMYDFETLLSTAKGYHRAKKEFEDVYVTDAEIVNIASKIQEYSQYSRHKLEKDKLEKKLKEYAKDTYAGRNVRINTDYFVIECKNSKPTIVTEESRQKAIEDAIALEVGNVLRNGSLSINVKPVQN